MIFSLGLPQVGCLIRMMKNACMTPDVAAPEAVQEFLKKHNLTLIRSEDRQAVVETYCALRSQIVGKLKFLDPFMRNLEWLNREIEHEEEPGNFDRHTCPDCKKNACRATKCTDCWQAILPEIHGTPDHVCTLPTTPVEESHIPEVVEIGEG